jgi:pimeloyl-ACP methyl ester carboxylesterase
LLPFVGTINAARDMDLIRQAVGDSKLTYLGFSYGSLLGATYAGLFPTHIRALVVDGALDPALDPVTATDQQSAALDHALTDFFTYCTTTPSCPWKPGGNPRAAFDALMTSIRNHPLAVGNRTVGAGEAFVGVVTPLYSRQSWPDLAIALQRAFEGDGSVLLQFFDSYTQRRADGTYPDTAAANSAVNCADQSWPTDLSVFPTLATTAAADAPEFGVANLYSGVLCSVWPFHSTLKPAPITAAGSPPLVVVGSTHDPITPYSWSQSLARELQHGVLLTRDGEGHTAYQASTCIQGYVDAYLINLTVPPAGTTCAS